MYHLRGIRELRRCKKPPAPFGRWLTEKELRALGVDRTYSSGDVARISSSRIIKQTFSTVNLYIRTRHTGRRDGVTRLDHHGALVAVESILPLPMNTTTPSRGRSFSLASSGMMMVLIRSSSFWCE